MAPRDSAQAPQPRAGWKRLRRRGGGLAGPWNLPSERNSGWWEGVVSRQQGPGCATDPALPCLSGGAPLSSLAFPTGNISVTKSGGGDDPSAPLHPCPCRPLAGNPEPFPRVLPGMVSVGWGIEENVFSTHTAPLSSSRASSVGSPT